MSEVRIFGIRHHGPGSARSLWHALNEWDPDSILIEGMPEVALNWASHPEMELPVAAVVYVEEQPQRALVAPMAEFSPEWVALRMGLDRGRAVEFIDMPAAIMLAQDWDAEPRTSDPFSLLGEASGTGDAEQWWDDQIESHVGADGLFESIGALMTELRFDVETPMFEAIREAFMRQGIRRAVLAGSSRIAVIVGAWHVPAVTPWDSGTEEGDLELTADLPRVKVWSSWVPWSYEKLATYSGYRAGILAPSYYEHRWQTPIDQRSELWLAKVAQLLRSEGLDTSPASVIEAARLAHMLSGMRSRREPGLNELIEAAQSVFGDGKTDKLSFVRSQLVIGQRIGAIPATLPSVPLVRDYNGLLKKLRLQGRARIELDVRKNLDLARSQFFFRLKALGVPLATLLKDESGTNTFREFWELHWQPETMLQVVGASGYGNTITEAAGSRLNELVSSHVSLPDLSAVLHDALAADLPEVSHSAIDRIEHIGVSTSDIPEMLQAIGALARSLILGQARNLDTGPLAELLDRLVLRTSVGLTRAVSGTTEDEGSRLGTLITPVAGLISHLVPEDTRAQWIDALRGALDSETLSGGLAGHLQRHVGALGCSSPEVQEAAFSRALGPGRTHVWSAAWLEGYLGPSGTLLLHNRPLFERLDHWINSLEEVEFEECLPLLRRTLSRFPKAERRKLAERVLDGGDCDLKQLDAEKLARVNMAIDEMFGGIS